MPRSLLGRRDQLTIATLLVVVVAVLAVAWVVAGGPAGRVIDIDRAEPLEHQFLVDLNSATWSELAELPDIGEVLARRIVETRTQRGKFTTSDDLLAVPGIGPRKLARIAPFLSPLAPAEAVAGN